MERGQNGQAVVTGERGITMAEEKKRKTPQAAVTGNVAYQLNQAQPKPERKQRETPQPQPQRSREAQRRARPAVREAQRVSLFGVIGFAVVGLAMALVLVSYVQLNSIYAETSAMEDTLSELKTEAGILEVEYNTIFDTATLTAAAEEAGLVTPTESQKVYLELEGTDNAVVYAPQTDESFLDQLGSGVQAIWLSFGS